MQANQRCKLTREIEVTRSSGDKLHEFFACNPSKFVEICPSIFQGCTVQGELGKNGFVIVWNYTLDGKTYVAKEMIENLDMEKKTITFRVIEGVILNHYKNFLLHIHATPKDGNMSLVKWTFEYEKINEDVPDPTSYAEIGVLITKLVSDHIKA